MEIVRTKNAEGEKFRVLFGCLGLLMILRFGKSGTSFLRTFLKNARTFRNGPRSLERRTIPRTCENVLWNEEQFRERFVSETFFKNGSECRTAPVSSCGTRTTELPDSDEFQRQHPALPQRIDWSLPCDLVGTGHTRRQKSGALDLVRVSYIQGWGQRQVPIGSPAVGGPDVLGLVGDDTRQPVRVTQKNFFF